MPSFAPKTELLRLCWQMPFLIVASVAYYLGFKIGIENADITYHLLPWFKEVKNDGLDVLSAEFSDYTPPYIYLLWIATKGSNLFSDIVLIKLVNIPFIFVSAILVYFILKEMGSSVSLAGSAAFGFVCLPTIVINGIWWGQTDIIYTCFLLMFFLYSLRRMPTAAAVAFGLAFSFKLQSIFLTPYLLFLFITGSIRLRHLLIIPITYMVMMIPAALAGRSWFDLVLIYPLQAAAYPYLSISAPNLYNLIFYAFPVVDTNTIFWVALLVSSFVGIGIVLFGIKTYNTSDVKLLIATMSALFLPFFLPRMHERYFFVADIFSFMLAFQFGRAWPIAVLVQLGSLFAYTNFLLGYARGPDIGAGLMTLAVIGLLSIAVHRRN